MKKIIYYLSVLLVLIITLYGINKIFSFKYPDGIYDLKSFYRMEKNTVDVVILGSSHAFENINTEVIWNDTGIATFDLGGSVAPMWNCYYYLKEAVKTQKPKLVILEAFSMTIDWDYTDDSRIIKNTYGLKMSKDKIDAIKVSSPRERWVEFLVQYAQYHNRYKDLTVADYKAYLNDPLMLKNWHGFGCNYEINEFSAPNVYNDGTREAIPNKQEQYYKEIIKYCKENGLELLVIVTPYPDYNEKVAHILNSAKDYAVEAGYKFVDFNEHTDEIGIDWSEDYASGAHMSYIGSEKFAHYFSKYLMDNYDFASHDKTDIKYAGYNQAYENYIYKAYDANLKRITDFDDYTDAIKKLDENHFVIVQTKTQIKNLDNSLIDLLKSWGIDCTSDTVNDGDCFIIEKGVPVKCEISEYGYSYAKRFGGKELVACKDGIFFERTNFMEDEEGVNIVVFDTKTHSVADSINVRKDKIDRYFK